MPCPRRNLHVALVIVAGYKESIIQLFTYDAQDMLRTNDCTFVIYLTFFTEID